MVSFVFVYRYFEIPIVAKCSLYALEKIITSQERYSGDEWPLSRRSRRRTIFAEGECYVMDSRITRLR